MATGYPKLDKTFIDTILQTYYLEVTGTEVQSFNEFNNINENKKQTFYDINGEITDISNYQWWDIELLDTFNQTSIFRYLIDKNTDNFVGGGFVSTGTIIQKFISFYGGFKNIKNIDSSTQIDISNSYLAPSILQINLNNLLISESNNNNEGYFTIQLNEYDDNGVMKPSFRYTFNHIFTIDEQNNTDTSSFNLDYGSIKNFTITN